MLLRQSHTVEPQLLRPTHPLPGMQKHDQDHTLTDRLIESIVQPWHACLGCEFKLNRRRRSCAVRPAIAIALPSPD